MRSLEFLLTHNFLFGDFYLQICGASMGDKFSLSLANLYMGWWERVRIFGSDSPRRKDTIFYCCFIDDLLFVVADEQFNMEAWLSYLNSNDLNLRFTGHCSSKSNEFLVVELLGSDNDVTSNLFRNPTAGNVLLRANSGHPKHTIRGIPVGQFPRVRRICSKDSDFIKEAEDMTIRFVDRGYPKSTISRAFKIAESTLNCQLILNGGSIRSNNGRKFPSNISTPVFSTPYRVEFHKI